MTTFWLSFTGFGSNRRQALPGRCHLRHGRERVSTTEIIKHAWALGVNPGGAVSVQEVGSIPDEHKNKLITDDALLLSLGSRGRQNQH